MKQSPIKSYLTVAGMAGLLFCLCSHAAAITVDTSDGVDQRGFTAPEIRDNGAYELQGIESCPGNLQTDGFDTVVMNADELNQAIECANLNGEANGGDTINLGTDINLLRAIDTTTDRTGTPAITSKLNINGNGLTIQRDQNLSCDTYPYNKLDNFRILLVESGGELSLQDISLKNGCLSFGHFSSGAAIYNKGTITSIHNVSFQSNHAKHGGGAIYLAPGSRIDAITDSEFLENLAGSAGGGAIGMKSADITLIEDSLFDANTTQASYSNGQGGGGALYMRDSSIGNLRNSTFSENMAAPSGGDGHGGAIFIEDSVITLLENSTFSKNSVSRFGGAIFVFYDGSVTLKNATFYQNTAGRADAIYIYEEEGFNSSNNLFVGHDQDCYIYRPDSTSINNNNLSTLTNGGCKGVLATTLTAATIGELADNGGPTMTHALLAGSEALDSAIAGTSTDQRGFAAFQTRDIGAYELQGIELCPVDLKTDGFTTIVSDADELNQAIECANFNGEANGGDTINLGADINLTTTIDTTIGNTGTPAITSKLSINGNGLTIQRDQNLACDLYGAPTRLHFRILLVARGGELNLHDVSLKNGCINNGNGAAIYNKGAINSIDNVSFQSNHADHGGGAIYLASGSRIDAITHSEFLENLAQYLGGGAIHMESADITLIENSLFDANTTQAAVQHGQGGGGALSVNNSSIETLRNSTFSENMATSSGGGHGGAIFIFRSVITLLENSTFSRNSAHWRGGAIYAYYDGSMTLNNATFYQNTATQADAIGMILDTVNSSNNLFVGHDQDCYIQNSGSTSNSSNNLSTLTNGGCPGALATTLTAATIGELADNGGPTMTHALLAGSEALDSAIAGTSTDQRGFAASGIRDMGAFEAQPPVVTAPADVSVEATGPLTSPALGSATVTDGDETGLVATANPAVDFPIGLTTVTWLVSDAYGFSGSATQAVTIRDTTAPILSLSGTDPINLLVGDSYTDEGATATDLVDDDSVLTTNIVVSNLPNTSLAGAYVINYDASDNAGNAAITITRTVNVLATVGGTLTGLATGNNVELQNNAGDNLVLSTDGGFTFAAPLAAGSMYEVNVVQQPANQGCEVNNGSGSVAGTHLTNVEVKCGDNSISLSSNALDYGNVATGNQSTNTVTVTNNGSTAVVISGFANPTAPFSLSGGSCSAFPVTLAAAESCEINVLFNPLVEGSFNDSFQVLSNAISSPDEVALSGNFRIMVVPTLSRWALMLLALLMFGLVYRERRHLK